MNAAQIHLLLNHVPVLGVVFVVVALAAGLWSRQGSLLRFGLVTLVAISLAAVPVYLSGGKSEERVEKIAGVHESMIELHEDMARAATVGLGVLGLVSLLALIRYRRRAMPMKFAAAMLAAAIVLSGGLAWTAHLGGMIRHSEIGGPASASVAPAENDEGLAHE